MSLDPKKRLVGWATKTVIICQHNRVQPSSDLIHHCEEESKTKIGRKGAYNSLAGELGVCQGCAGSALLCQ